MGAILIWTGFIQFGRDPNTLAEARDCFLEGFRRGLPFYSKGVGYLLDGLNRFAHDARKTSNGT